MTAAFDWAKYTSQPSSEEKPAFDWSKYTVKKQEPVTLKGAAGSYGAGVAGGAGGFVKDVQSLTEAIPQPVRAFIPGIDLTSKLAKASGAKGTHELTTDIQEAMGVAEPGNAFERILSQSGQFGGQEALIGTALGGPAGAVAGLAHGSASGALYGGLKELGVNDEVALAVTALATISPIAARAYLNKQATKSAAKTATAAAEPTVPTATPPSPPGAPPSPPGAPPSPPFGPGTVLPETKGAFAQKEAVVKALEKPIEGKPLGVTAEVANVKAEAPSLQGRASEAQELGEALSKEPFETEAQAGRTISKDVTQARDAERDIVREKYKQAEEITSTHNDIYPKLAKENEDRISRLEALEKRSAGEEAVYQDALTLRKMIGNYEGYIETNADRLMKQANSFSQKVKYELPYAGYKGEIKSIVHEMNNAVIESLESAGKNSAAVKDADRTFSRFADRFMGDEISPYFQKKIRDPEKLGMKAISDAATYRAVKAALGSRKSPLVDKIDREVVHGSMDKYYKDPSKVNSKEYVKDLKNLAEKIGKEKTGEVDYFLRKKQLGNERKTFLENKLKETQIAREKVPMKERAKPIALEKPLVQTPEQLDKLFNSRSEIRRLKKEMKATGLDKEFEALAERKIEEIFKEGGFGEKKVTGSDLKRIIDKEHDILAELLGEEELSLLYKVASKAGAEELTKEIVTQVVKSAGKMALQFAGLGKLVKLIPLNRI